MKLGDSLGRRRRLGTTGRSDSSSSEELHGTADRAAGRVRGGTAPRSRLGIRDVVIGVVVLGLVGWAFGYGLATRVLFPAPPPPGDLFEVPDLRGMGLPSVRERLAGAGLELGPVDSLQHPSVGSGLVLGQSPLPGQILQPETPVRVTLSSGLQTAAVPDVLSLDEAGARIVLETSGFIVNVATAEADEPRGQVVRVSPPPDSIVALPSEVLLVVSAGPPVVSMPLVLGLEQAEAEMLLDSLGLEVTDVEEVFRFGRDQGIVVEQEPAADTELRRGGSVRLKVGRRGREGEH